MFSNFLRTQAWLTVRTWRAPIRLVSRIAPFSPRFSNIPPVSIRRSLSTSRSIYSERRPEGFNDDRTPPLRGESSNLIYVGNFPYDVKEHELREKFETFGPIAEVRIETTKKGDSRGYGHVLFVNEADAAAVLRVVSRDPMYISDRRLRLRYPTPPGNRVTGTRIESNQLFVGNLPFVLEEHELREKFEIFGKVSDVRIGYHPDGRARGFAHIEFTKREDAVAAFESANEEPIYLFGRDLRVDYPQRRVKQASSPSRQLFIGNLPYMYEKHELREAFEAFGPVSTVRFGFDDKGRAFPYAHVEFINEADVHKAYQAAERQPIRLFGRDLRVEYVKSSQEEETSSPLPITSLFFDRFNGDEVAVREVFKSFDNRIVGVTCLRDPGTRELTGKGFIAFIDDKYARQALETLTGNVDFDLALSK